MLTNPDSLPHCPAAPGYQIHCPQLPLVFNISTIAANAQHQQFQGLVGLLIVHDISSIIHNLVFSQAALKGLDQVNRQRARALHRLPVAATEVRLQVARSDAKALHALVTDAHSGEWLKDQHC
eukprot:GHUV01031407.1.p1 GENE.GHUV01031407.1~~GHUV01031407.1.p1  ORF type:complete len:134 (-),score=2.89 GHUV01031407.1:392-760(-)